MSTDPLDLDECQRIHDAMTPWPFYRNPNPDDRSALVRDPERDTTYVAGERTAFRLAPAGREADLVGLVYKHNAWPALIDELRRLRAGVGLIACPHHGEIASTPDPDADACRHCGGSGAVSHEHVLAELRAARERIAHLEERLREATDLDTRDAEVMAANRARRMAEQRIAALEARESELVAALDCALELCNVPERNWDDEHERECLRLAALAHPEPR